MTTWTDRWGDETPSDVLRVSMEGSLVHTDPCGHWPWPLGKGNWKPELEIRGSTTGRRNCSLGTRYLQLLFEKSDISEFLQFDLTTRNTEFV